MDQTLINRMKFFIYVSIPFVVLYPVLFTLVILLYIPIHELNVYLHENFLATWVMLTLSYLMIIEAIKNRKLLLRVQ